MNDTYAAAVVRLPSSVKVRHEVDMRNGETRVSVDGIRVEDPRRLIGAIWHCRPEVWQRREFTAEGYIDEFGYEFILRRVGRCIFLAEGLVSGLGFQRESLDRDREEIALILSERCAG